MKGLEDDPDLLTAPTVPLNVRPIRDSGDLDVQLLTESLLLAHYGVSADDLEPLKQLFLEGTTFGSLLKVPETLSDKLPALARLCRAPTPQDAFAADALRRLRPLVAQAQLLARRYGFVVTNPPYMGSGSMCASLKKHVRKHYPTAYRDLFACFIQRGLDLAKPGGFCAMVTMHSWMFLSSFEKMRCGLLRTHTIRVLAHLGARAFESISGQVVQTAAFVLQNAPPQSYKPTFTQLVDGCAAQKRQALLQGKHRYQNIAQHQFELIPGSPIAYWLSDALLDAFRRGTPLGQTLDARVGLQIGDTSRFLRRWWEVDYGRIGFGMRDRKEAQRSGKKWFPHNKGGTSRKWYGNHEYVVNWEEDGREIRLYGSEDGGKPRSRVQNIGYYFRKALTWSDIASGPPSFRLNDGGDIHGNKGNCAFECAKVGLRRVAGFSNSPVLAAINSALNPTLSFSVGYFAKIPFVEPTTEQEALQVDTNVSALTRIARKDWDAFESSWDFQGPPVLPVAAANPAPLETCYHAWVASNREAARTTRSLEEEINRVFIDAYGLADELSPVVPLEEVTLTVNPAYRYRSIASEEERQARFLRDSITELVSFAIACMMGRYSLDAPGLVYAGSGSEGFDFSRYTAFPADNDGIVPITAQPWFEDDAANRLIRFVATVWDPTELETNLSFLAKGLSANARGSSRSTLRRYLVRGFYKDHLTTYKKRPIYWLFTSGRRRTFQCLVYLHRYHEGTLARMRTDYVIALQSKTASRLKQLTTDIESAGRARQRRLEKEKANLQKDLLELQDFDDKLRYFADQQISLDLDDGVKVNYGKFGGLLANVRGITGRPPAS